MKLIRRTIGLFLILLASFSLFSQPAQAQSDQPLALVMTADGPIMPPMLEYIKRGVETADRRNADVLIIQLNTPGGDLLTTIDIIGIIRASDVPVVIYVSPKNAIAGSAGALITMAGHVSAMAPESAIGASSPISSSGENLNSTAETKAVEISKAAIRPLVEPRGKDALALAESMIDSAKAATADEALKVHLIDFIATDVNDLLNKLDGFTVQMDNGPRTLHTKGANTEPLNMSFIEEFLLLLTNPNYVFGLLSLGTTALIIEISSPGGWVAGFVGVVCITLSIYGMGVLPLNWFGIIFVITAFVLFILDIKAPTHGALTTAGVASFIIGALVLFNSPGTPDFLRVSVPLVIATGISIGLLFFGILMFALRAMRAPVSMGAGAFIGKIGTATGWSVSGGQVQLQSELWTADATDDSAKISKGDKVEVVEVKGLRLKVRKIK